MPINITHQAQNGVRDDLREGSVIAITVLFMSFLLIGIVGAAYLLSSHLRITSLGADFLQASYNAESGLEVALYEIKHRREGYESERNIAWDTESSSQSSIEYRMKANDTITLPLLGTTRKLALFYEDGATGNLEQMSSKPNLWPQLTVYSSKTEPENCLDVNLIGKLRSDGSFESISTPLPCAQKGSAPISLSSLKDITPSNASSTPGQDYTFMDFLTKHDDVLLLIGDISLNSEVSVDFSLTGASDTPQDLPRTIANPSLKIEATGTYRNTNILKGIELPQDKLPDILSRVIVY